MQLYLFFNFFSPAKQFLGRQFGPRTSPLTVCRCGGHTQVVAGTKMGGLVINEWIRKREAGSEGDRQGGASMIQPCMRFINRRVRSPLAPHHFAMTYPDTYMHSCTHQAHMHKHTQTRHMRHMHVQTEIPWNLNALGLAFQFPAICRCTAGMHMWPTLSCSIPPSSTGDKSNALYRSHAKNLQNACQSI